MTNKSHSFRIKYVICKSHMIICYLRQKDKVDYSMKDKIKKLWNGVKKFSCENVLLLVFLFSSIVNSFVLRAYTVKNWTPKAEWFKKLTALFIFSVRTAKGAPILKYPFWLI